MSGHGNKGGAGKNGSVGAGDYEVGYGKPPKHAQYKAGQTGNRKGRPRRARGKHMDLKAHLQPTNDIILEEAYALVEVRSGHRKVKMPAIQAVMKATVKSAVEGAQMSQRTFMEWTRHVEKQAAELNLQIFGTLHRYKRRCTREFRECRAAGRPAPEFLPHPDDIVLNWETLTAEVRGPATPEAKAELDERLKERDDWEQDFAWACKIYENLGRTEAGLLNALLSQNNYDLINVSLPERYQKELEGRLRNPVCS
jgi:hypothetical protein